MTENRPIKITAKLFASLAEQYQIEEKTIELAAPTSALGIWLIMTSEKHKPDNIKVAVNYEYVDEQYIVDNGDEIAFMPPVTGG